MNSLLAESVSTIVVPVKKDITQHEISALKTRFNLADAHTHQDQSNTQRNIVARLPELWYQAESQTQYQSEQSFIQAFFRFHGQLHALKRHDEIYLVYAASIAMHITATYLRKKNMSVGLIEPCFDNLHDLLKHMEVPMTALDERLFYSPVDVYANLQTAAAGLDAIFLVDPNNPTGSSLFAEGPETFIEVARYPTDLASLRSRLVELVAMESSEVPASARYVADEMTLDEFRILVQEFALDGLTEAQVFYHLMPRLSLPAQMPMLRMMIDEFGSGNLKRSHTTLYQDLLTELGMPIDLPFYIEANSSAGFSFPNMFCWLAMRADDPSWFAGVITYFETVVPTFFECYTQICQRLNIKAHTYYSEHVHIDVFHAIEGQRLLKAMDVTGDLDPVRAWRGICMSREITNAAFDSAVEKARRLKHFKKEIFLERAG